jgi:superfamily II DNA or RNA helicase
MYNHPSKKEKLIEIVDKFNTKNIITFSESISFVNEVTERLGSKACAYHSEQTDEELKKMLNNFKHHRGKIKVVNTAKALNQGVDIPKIDLAVISAWNSSSIQMNQRIGRALRKSKNKNRAIIVITPLSRTDFKKTQDEKWLEAALKDIPKEKIKYISTIDEIENE